MSLQPRLGFISYLEEKEKKCEMAVGVSAGLFGAWRARAAQFFFLLMLFSFPIFRYSSALTIVGCTAWIVRGMHAGNTSVTSMDCTTFEMVVLVNCHWKR